MSGKPVEVIPVAEVVTELPKFSPEELEAVRVLKSHEGVPEEFQAIGVLKADKQVLQNSKDYTNQVKLCTSDPNCLCLCPFLPLTLIPPVCCILWGGLFKTQKLLKSLFEDAEHDIYIYGKQGCGVVNRGKVKVWTPATDNVLAVMDQSIFKYESSGACGTTIKYEPVLVIKKSSFGGRAQSSTCCEPPLASDIKNQIVRQIWFVQVNPGVVGNVNGAISGGFNLGGGMLGGDLGQMMAMQMQSMQMQSMQMQSMQVQSMQVQSMSRT